MLAIQIQICFELQKFKLGWTSLNLVWNHTSVYWPVVDCVVDLFNKTMAETPMHDSHRLFLQTFMSQGMLGGDEVQDAFQEACTRFRGNHHKASWFLSSLVLSQWVHSLQAWMCAQLELPLAVFGWHLVAGVYWNLL